MVGDRAHASGPLPGEALKANYQLTRQQKIQL